MNQITKPPGWTLQDAKARFSELVRLARADGPQLVTVRGQDAVVVIAAEELARLMAPKSDFLSFMESLSVEGLDLTRDNDTGRDVVL